MFKMPTLEMLTAHIHAQDAALFFVSMVALLVLGIWSGIKEERKPSKHR